MEVWEYALFFSLTKLAWAVAVAWVIFACHHGYGGIVNSILSRKAYLPITRLSFCAYLVHPAMMVIYYFLQEGLFHATILTLVRTKWWTQSCLKTQYLNIIRDNHFKSSYNHVFDLKLLIGIHGCRTYCDDIYSKLLLSHVFRATIRCIGATCLFS